MAAMPEGVVLAPTVTKLPAQARGAVLLTGSHGGRYAGCCALAAGVRAVVFHDAGIGRDQAGIASLPMFEALGVPAAAISHHSARIGDAEDIRARGRISAANAPARALGVAEGQTCVHAEDAGAVVVTASHGGLVGGDPAMALRTDAFAALFNDAGIGIEQAGIARLAALDARGIAAAAVGAASARIGEARSTLDDGVLSAVNGTAAALGAAVGARARDVVAAWACLR
jgi:hypothetical protein